MMKRSLFFVAACLGWPGLVLHAQTGQSSLSADPQKELSLTYGLAHLARQDQIFSPFVHQDWSALNFGLRWARQAKTQQWAEFNVNSFQASQIPGYGFGNNQVTFPHQFLMVNLKYGQGLRDFQGERTRLSTGVHFQSNVQPATYWFGWTSHSGYFASFNTGVWAQIQSSQVGKQQWQVRALLPLFSWVARSPYLVNDDQFIQNNYTHNGVKTFFAYVGDGALQLPHQIQQLELRGTYQYQLSSRWSLGAAYDFQLIHASKPAGLLAFQNGFSLLSTLKF